MQFVTKETTRTRQRLSWIINPALLAAFCLGAGLYSIAKGTDANWDLRNYHLYSAFAFAEGRLFHDMAPAQLQSYLNPILHLPTYYLLILLNEKPRLFAFVQGIPAGIYGFLVLRISALVASTAFGRTRMAYACAVIATAVAVTGAGFTAVLGTSTGDTVIGMLSLAALAIVLEEVVHPLRRQWRLAAAGALAGIALAGKLTALSYCAPLGLIVLAMLGLRAAFAFGLSAALAFLVFWGPHAWHLWSVTGNPQFPLSNNIFKSPDWLPLGLFWTNYLPRSALEFVFYPFVWTVDQTRVTELPMRDLRLAVLYPVAAIALALAFVRRGAPKPEDSPISKRANTRIVIALWGFVVIAYVVWASAFGIYRYLIVLESLSGACLIAAGAVIFRRSEAKVLALLLAVLVAANVWITRPDWGHVEHAYRVIDVEPLPVPAAALVVIADNHPHGYLVPFLPPDARVISIRNNLVRPDQEHGLNRRMREIVSSHAGPIIAISSTVTAEATMQEALAQYRLRAESCAVVRSNIEPAGHRVCRASRF